MAKSDWAENIVRDLWRKYDLHPNIKLTNHTSLPTDLIKALREAKEAGYIEGSTDAFNQGFSQGLERAAKIADCDESCTDEECFRRHIACEIRKEAYAAKDSKV